MSEDLPVNTTNSLRTLHRSPFTKALFMDVIPTGCSTPDDFFFLGLELHETDGAVAFDGLSVAGGFVVGVGLLAVEGGSLVDSAKFLTVYRWLGGQAYR